MLLHCDVPVAEPIAHDDLDGDGELADRCARAANAQVRRDTNHPSVILWSAMNELGLDCVPARARPGYEAFARRVAGAVRDADPTRPLIENDWIEPDPERVFTTPVLTAHWYGRLHAAWLAELEPARMGRARAAPVRHRVRRLGPARVAAGDAAILVAGRRTPRPSPSCPGQGRRPS